MIRTIVARICAGLNHNSVRDGKSSLYSVPIRQVEKTSDDRHFNYQKNPLSCLKIQQIHHMSTQQKMQSKKAQTFTDET